jgi:hypothetical protein
MSVIVNNLPAGTELEPSGVDYRYRLRGRKNRLIKFYPGAGTTMDQADADVGNYFYSGYVVNNPGYEGNTFVSYTGIYIDGNNSYTGAYTANTQVEQY